MGREARGGGGVAISATTSVTGAGSATHTSATHGSTGSARSVRLSLSGRLSGGRGRSPQASTSLRRGYQRRALSRSLSPDKGVGAPVGPDPDAFVLFSDDVGDCLEHLFDVERWLNDGLPPPPEKVVLKYKARDLQQSLLRRLAERTFRFHHRAIEAPGMLPSDESDADKAAFIETRPLPPEPVLIAKPAAAPTQPARRKPKPPPVVMTLQQIKEMHIMQHQQALLASQAPQVQPYEAPPWVDEDRLPLESAEFTDWLDSRRKLAKELDGLGLTEEWLSNKERSALEESYLQRLRAKAKPPAPPPTKTKAKRGGRHQKTAWMKKIEAEARESAERRLSKNLRHLQTEIQQQQQQVQQALQSAIRKRSINRMRRTLSQSSVSTTGAIEFLLPTIQGLNKSTRDTFILTLRHIFISAPMLAERLYNFRPFNNYDALMEKAEKMALSSHEREFVAMLNNQAALEAEKLKQATLLEWARLGNPYTPPSDPEKAERRAIDRRLRELHEAYVAKFGFPAVGIDAGQSKAKQIYPLEIRLQHERQTEIEFGIKSTLRLSKDRLSQLLAASHAANKKQAVVTKRNPRYSKASISREFAKGSGVLSSSSRTSLVALSSVASVTSPMPSMILDTIESRDGRASPFSTVEEEKPRAPPADKRSPSPGATRPDPGATPPVVAGGAGVGVGGGPAVGPQMALEAPPGMRRVDILVVNNPMLSAVVEAMMSEQHQEEGQGEQGGDEDAKPPAHLPPLTLSSLQRLNFQQLEGAQGAAETSTHKALPAPHVAPTASRDRPRTPNNRPLLSPIMTNSRSGSPSRPPSGSTADVRGAALSPTPSAQPVPATAEGAVATQPVIADAQVANETAPAAADAPAAAKPKRPFGGLRGSISNLKDAKTSVRPAPRASVVPPVGTDGTVPAGGAGGVPPLPKVGDHPGVRRPSILAPAARTARGSVSVSRGGLRGRTSNAGRGSISKGSKGFRLRFSARGEVPFTSTLAESYPLLFQHRVRLERELESALTLAEEKGLTCIAEDTLVRGMLPPSDKRLREIRQRLRQPGLELLESPVPLVIRIAEPEEPSMEIIDTKHAYRKASKRRATIVKPTIVRLSTGWGAVTSKVDCWMTYEEYTRLTEGLNTKFRRFIGEKFVHDDATWPDPFSKVVPVYMPEDYDMLGKMRARGGVDTSGSVFSVINRLDVRGHQEHWVFSDNYLVRGDAKPRASFLM